MFEPRQPAAIEAKLTNPITPHVPINTAPTPQVELETPEEEKKLLNHARDDPELVIIDPPQTKYSDDSDEDDIPPDDLQDMNLTSPSEKKFVHGDNLALQLQLEEYKQFLNSSPPSLNNSSSAVPPSNIPSTSVAHIEHNDDTKTVTTLNPPLNSNLTLNTIMAIKGLGGIIAEHAGLEASIKIKETAKGWETAITSESKQHLKIQNPVMMQRIEDLKAQSELVQYCCLNKHYAQFVLLQPYVFGITERDGFFIALSHDLVTDEMIARINSDSKETKALRKQLNITEYDFFNTLEADPEIALENLKQRMKDLKLKVSVDWAWLDQGIRAGYGAVREAENLVRYRNLAIATKWRITAVRNIIHKLIMELSSGQLYNYCLLNREVAQFVIQNSSKLSITKQQLFLIAVSHDLATNAMKSAAKYLNINKRFFSDILNLRPNELLAEIERIEEEDPDVSTQLRKQALLRSLPIGVKSQDDNLRRAKNFIQYRDLEAATNWRQDYLKNSEVSLENIMRISGADQLPKSDLIALAFRNPTDIKFALSNLVLKPILTAYLHSKKKNGNDPNTPSRVILDFYQKYWNHPDINFLLDNSALPPKELFNIAYKHSGAAVFIASNPRLACQIPLRDFFSGYGTPTTWRTLILTNIHVAKIALRSDHLGFDLLEPAELLKLMKEGLAEDIFARYAKNKNWTTKLHASDWVNITDYCPNLAGKIFTSIGHQLKTEELLKLARNSQDSSVVKIILDRIATYESPEVLMEFLDLLTKSNALILSEMYGRINAWTQNPQTDWVEKIKANPHMAPAIIFSKSANKYTSAQFFAIAQATRNNPDIVRFILEAHEARIDKTTKAQLLGLVAPPLIPIQDIRPPDLKRKILNPPKLSTDLSGQGFFKDPSSPTISPPSEDPGHLSIPVVEESGGFENLT